MSEGTYGGPDKRPGSAPEIQKLPTGVCVKCHIRAPAPIVVNAKCTNEGACARRQRLNAEARAKADVYAKTGKKR